MHKNNKKYIFWLVVLLLLIGGAQFVSAWLVKPFPLSIHFLDVGQGDAILITYLQDYQVLIDGGPEGKPLMYELGKVMPASDNHIELVILTHPDKDHLAGLIQAVKHYEVGMFLDNGQVADTDIYRELYAFLDSKQVQREAVGAGSKITIGEQFTLSVLNPDRVETHSDEKNDASVVLRLDFGDNAFLFMGDAEEKVEKNLLAKQDPIDVDWLKVAHHGAKNATTEEFLHQVTPEQAIISVGKDNRFRHPSQEVLERLQIAQVPFSRTDNHGTITVDCEDTKKSCHIR